MNRLFLKEEEVGPCTLFGVRIVPRYLFNDTDDWFQYLKGLNIEKVNRAFSHLDKHNKNGMAYEYLSDLLCGRLIEKCELIQDLDNSEAG